MTPEERPTHIAIPFEGGAYIQRLEPETASVTPLSTSERLIIHLHQAVAEAEDNSIKDLRRAVAAETERCLKIAQDALDYNSGGGPWRRIVTGIAAEIGVKGGEV